MSRLKHLNPYELHKHLINEYILVTKGDTRKLTRDGSKDKTDLDVIRENHKFLWDDEPADTWEKRLAKKYYDKLFKEYCICDLSRYKENKVALRWRTEQEVYIGKGQFECGNKKCNDKISLKSWEVNFAYSEHGEKKNALVKLRLCASCSDKLNYHTKKREVKRLKRKDKGKSKESRKSTVELEKEDRRGDQGSGADEAMEETSDKEPVASSSQTQESENDPWKKGPVLEDKSRDEEFEDYLEDLLL